MHADSQGRSYAHKSVLRLLVSSQTSSSRASRAQGLQCLSHETCNDQEQMSGTTLQQRCQDVPCSHRLASTEKSTSKASRKRKAHLQVARHGSRRADKQLTQKHYLVPSLFDYLQLLPSLWGVRSCTLQHFSETFQSLIGNRDARSHNYS